MKRLLLITITALLAASPSQAKGVKWMDENKPKDETILRFRDEAAKVLRIPVKPPAAKEKTEAKPKVESGKPK